METFSASLAICAGNSPVTGEFPAQRPVTRCFDVFFDLRLNKRLINNRHAGDLRRHCAHYGVTVLIVDYTLWIKSIFDQHKRVFLQENTPKISSANCNAAMCKYFNSRTHATLVDGSLQWHVNKWNGSSQEINDCQICFMRPFGQSQQSFDVNLVSHSDGHKSN